MESMFKKHYSAKILIEADAQLVWDILVDENNYSHWNPFTPKIETDWKIGNKVRMTVHMKPGKSPLAQTEYLSKLNPPNELAWGMNWGWFLKAERVQRLTRQPDGKVTYFTDDVIYGLACPLVHLLYGKHIQNGFEKLALALKKYAEQL